MRAVLLRHWVTGPVDGAETKRGKRQVVRRIQIVLGDEINVSERAMGVVIGARCENTSAEDDEDDDTDEDPYSMGKAKGALLKTARLLFVTVGRRRGAWRSRYVRKGLLGGVRRAKSVGTPLGRHSESQRNQIPLLPVTYVSKAR